VDSVYYNGFNAFNNVPDVAEAVRRLYGDCDNPPDDIPNFDLGQCKLGILQKLTSSEIEYSEDADGDACAGSWVDGEDGRPGRIVVHGSRKDCAKNYPDDRYSRVVEARKGAYLQEQETAFDGATDFTKAIAQLYAFCDANTGGVDPEECKKEQRELLTNGPFDREEYGGDCTARIENRNGRSTVQIGGPCTEAFPADPEARKKQVDAGVEEYKPAPKSPTGAALVQSVYDDCTKRAAAAPSGDPAADAAKCSSEASAVASEKSYALVVTGSDTCQAAWDPAASKIVLTGSETACKETAETLPKQDVPPVDPAANPPLGPDGQPIQPPVGPDGQPIQPVDPAAPGEPGQPANPGQPVPPADPAAPGQPVPPADPAAPGQPVPPADPAAPQEPGPPPAPKAPEPKVDDPKPKPKDPEVVVPKKPEPEVAPKPKKPEPEVAPKPKKPEPEVAPKPKEPSGGDEGDEDDKPQDAPDGAGKDEG
jgi:hypothetical protein